ARAAGEGRRRPRAGGAGARLRAARLAAALGAPPVTRVALVEDQALVRAGLRTLLEKMPGIVVVLELRDGEEAVQRLPSSMAEVALIDVRLPGRNGIEVIQELQRSGRAPPSILLTTFEADAA